MTSTRNLLRNVRFVPAHVLAVTSLLLSARGAMAVAPTPGESALRDEWVAGRFGEHAPRPPVSFTLDGRSYSAETPQAWTSEPASTQAGGGKNVRRFAWTDSATGLRVRCEATVFGDHPAVEWVAWLENTAATPTPIIADIRALDTTLPADDATVLHYARGAVCSMDDFEPLTLSMKVGAKLHLQPAGGRSSSDFLPFFNLENAPRGGIVMGLGWSGEWAADFERESDGGTRVRAGMALTRLKLVPGESIRTPAVAMLFYQGDRLRGQNLWRRFILDRHRPQVDGAPMKPLLLNGNWGATRAAEHLANIQAIAARGLPVDVYWIDAEWFGDGPWFLNAGNWNVKRDLYPEGFRPLGDALRPAGRKLLLWFEPERVCEGTPWARQHAEWLLEVPQDRRCYRWGDKQSYPDWVVAESRRNQIKENDRLFNLALPEARRFLTEFVSARISEWGLGCYRHDANIAPLEFWRAADAPDRQGITEIRWVEGLYAFWDDLLKRHPGLLIDNCASGGRRIDLETLSRSTPFWRTDFAGNVTARQSHNYGLSFWVPLNATGGATPGRDSDYVLRSTFSSCMVINLFGNGDAPQAAPAADDFPFERARQAMEQYRRIQPCFLGDYYPLTPYSKAADAWLGWQFDRDDTGEGVALLFRREKCTAAELDIRLCGLAPDASYELRFEDGGQLRTGTGRELAEPLRVRIAQAPGSALLTYRRR